MKEPSEAKSVLRAALPLSAEQMRQQVKAIQRLMKAVMRDGEHYGCLPGSRKPSLWKAGAEKLCVAFHIAPSFVIEDLSTPEQCRYRVRCVGTHQLTGIILGEGLGACSSMEQRYKWRRAADQEFDRVPEERRRVKYGYDRETESWYELKQVRSEPEDLENSILKMACKRAHVAMTLNVTAASDIFTQDIEDLPEGLENERAVSATHAIEQPQPKKKGKKAAKLSPDKPASAEAEDIRLNEGQKRVLRARMQKAAISEEALAERFGAPLEALPAAKFSEVAAWLRDGGRP